jgi:glutathione S-transferase
MVLKLFGRAAYGYTTTVLVTLKEKGLSYQIQEIDTAAKEQKTPEHLERHPFGKIPVLVSLVSYEIGSQTWLMVWQDDDGFIVYESRAISRYISKKYRDQGTPLLPPEGDLQAEAHFDQAASIEFANWDPLLYDICVTVFFKQSVMLHQCGSFSSSSPQASRHPHRSRGSRF